MEDFKGLTLDEIRIIKLSLMQTHSWTGLQLLFSKLTAIAQAIEDQEYIDGKLDAELASYEVNLNALQG